MKKIFALCLCLCLTAMSLGGIAYAEGTIDVDLTSDKYGHIYTEAGQSFKIDVNNTLSTDFSGKIEYNVISDGAIIYSAENEVNIVAGGRYTDFPVLNCPKYGIFELEAKVTDGTAVYGTDTISFSYINASNIGEGNKKMCVNTHMDIYRNGDQVIKAMTDAGFGGLRNPIYWFVVEVGEKNNYVLPEVATDIRNAAEAGLEPLVVLSHGNKLWDVTDTEGKDLGMAPSTDEQIQAFANYCGYVASQYKGTVKYYEIWNEFELDSTNAGDRSGTAYAKMLAPAAEAIKKADPDAKVVAMCAVNVNRTFISEALNQLKAMGKSDCFDIISVHPYSVGKEYGNFKSHIDSLKTYTDKPIWFSERGWDASTSTAYASANGISEMQQAVYGVWDYLANAEYNLCDRWFWYDFQNDGTDPANREHNFGLIRATTDEVPGEAKPAYVAFAAMNKLIGQSTYKSVATNGNAKAYRFTYENGDDIYAVTGNVGDTITVNMTGKLELLDMYSNVVATDDNKDGSYTVTLTEQVMYVRRHYEPAGCTITVSGDELIVTGHTVENDQQVSVMVTSVEGDYIYMGQTTCDNERAYSFTADRKGVNELYVKVNYGNLYNTSIETGIVLKLMCNNERILSLDEVTSTDNIELIVSVNDAITTATDIHVAAYNEKELKSFNTTTLKPGTAMGDYSVKIKLNDNNYDKISGFVWEKMEPIMDKVDFE